MREHNAKTQNKRLNLPVFLVNGTLTKNNRMTHTTPNNYQIVTPPTCHVRVSYNLCGIIESFVHTLIKIAENTFR